MHALTALALDSNPRLCGPLPSPWAPGGASAPTIITFGSGLGEPCQQQGSAPTRPRPGGGPVLPVVSATFSWPGGGLQDLQRDGGQEELRFREQHRRWG